MKLQPNFDVQFHDINFILQSHYLKLQSNLILVSAGWTVVSTALTRNLPPVAWLPIHYPSGAPASLRLSPSLSLSLYLSHTHTHTHTHTHSSLPCPPPLLKLALWKAETLNTTTKNYIRVYVYIHGYMCRQKCYWMQYILYSFLCL